MRKLADGAGDVGLGRADVVAPQDLGRCVFAVGVVWIDVERHWVIYPGLADGGGLMDSGANNVG